MPKPLDHPTDHLLEQFQHLFRSMHCLKAQAGGDSPERAAYFLLSLIAQRGPQRATELAEATHADPSTVSRHLSLLSNHGLIERIPDQSDGRATVLALTAAGREVDREQRERRRQLLAEIVSDWPEEDVNDLTRLLERFNAGVNISREKATRSPDSEAPLSSRRQKEDA